MCSSWNITNILPSGWHITSISVKNKNKNISSYRLKRSQGIHIEDVINLWAHKTMITPVRQFQMVVAVEALGRLHWYNQINAQTSKNNLACNSSVIKTRISNKRVKKNNCDLFLLCFQTTHDYTLSNDRLSNQRAMISTITWPQIPQESICYLRYPPKWLTTGITQRVAGPPTGTHIHQHWANDARQLL